MLPAGTQLGKYKVSKLLGSGGMADVYLATDVRMKRQVAMKVLPPEFARSADHAERFRREVMASAALDHPCIVDIFDVGQSEYNSLKYQYYVMKLLPNGDLKTRIKKKLKLGEICRIMKDMGEALAYAHKQGFVHRDIKPENILFDRENRAVLTDLGIARAMRTDNRMTDTGMSVGTPNYMSPEQAKGKYNLDGRADIYSLGVVFFEMLTGDLPYHADTTIGLALKHVNDPVPTLPRKFQALQPMIDRFMAKDPEDRYPNAKAMLVDIANLEKFGRSRTNIVNNNSHISQKKRVRPRATGAKIRNVKSFLRRKRWLIIMMMIGLASAFYWDSIVKFFPKQKEERRRAANPPPSVDQLEAISLVRSNTKKRREQLKNQSRIRRLLKLADDDLANLRLTKPQGNSAYDKYRQVLALDSDNASARRGIRKIVDSYLKLAETSIAQDDIEGAIGYVETAKDLDPDSSEVARVLLQYQQMLRAKKNLPKVTLSEREKLPVARKKTPPAREPVSRPKPQPKQTTNYRAGQRFYDKMAINSSGPQMIVIPEGTFNMGSTNRDAEADERPVIRVTFRRKFAVSIYEITFDDYDKFARATDRARPSDEGWGRGERPVINVSWFDAVNYTAWLSKQTGNSYRLLSEAEWEYVARAGRYETYTWGEKASRRFANFTTDDSFDANERRVRKWDRTAPVGSFSPNRFGLFDIAGNVWEWVMDCKTPYGDSHRFGEPVTTPNCDERIVRGGSWGSTAEAVRTTNRAERSPLRRGRYSGFRVMRDLD